MSSNPCLFTMWPHYGTADPRHLNRIYNHMCDTCGEYPDENGVLRHGRGCDLDVEVIPEVRDGD